MGIINVDQTTRSEESPGKRFSPNAAIEGALAIMRGSLQTSGIQIELHIAPDLPEVSGSLVPMEQVLVNGKRRVEAVLPRGACCLM